MDSFHCSLCQKLSGAFSTHLPHGIVKISKDFLVKFRQLVVTKGRQDAADVLPVAGQCAGRQFFRRDLFQPDFNVFSQGEAAVHRLSRGMFYLLLIEHCLLVQPLLRLLRRQPQRRVDRLLGRLQTVPLVIVPTGHHQQIAVFAAFSDACHL